MGELENISKNHIGCSAGDMDMLIAAAALSQNAVLVSHKVRHFSRIRGLKVEDWA